MEIWDGNIHRERDGQMKVERAERHLGFLLNKQWPMITIIMLVLCGLIITVILLYVHGSWHCSSPCILYTSVTFCCRDGCYVVEFSIISESLVVLLSVVWEGCSCISLRGNA